MLHLVLLISKQQLALLTSLVRPALSGLRARPNFASSPPQLKQLLDNIGL